MHSEAVNECHSVVPNRWNRFSSNFVEWSYYREIGAVEILCTEVDQEMRIEMLEWCQSVVSVYSRPINENKEKGNGNSTDASQPKY